MGWAGVYSWLLCHFPKSSMWHPSSGFQVWLRWVFKAHKGKKRRSWEERGGDPKCPLHLLCVVTPLPCPSMMVLSLYRLLKLSGGTRGDCCLQEPPAARKWSQYEKQTWFMSDTNDVVGLVWLQKTVCNFILEHLRTFLSCHISTDKMYWCTRHVPYN